MIRRGLSLLVGSGMAIVLFWLLALLVAPPDREPEQPVMSMSMAMVEAPTPQPDAPAPAPAEVTPSAAPPPMPTPEPPPVADSQITLPEPELPEAPREPVELDSQLPELTEMAPPPPEPEPTPEPQPEPPPEPAPEPASQTAPHGAPASEAAATQSASSSAAAAAAPAPSNEPVDVGSIAATREGKPNYPPRAQRRGMEGFVELEFVIRRDGSVDASSIRVTAARPRRVFEDAAIEAIKDWHYPPSDRLRRSTRHIEFELR